MASIDRPWQKFSEALDIVGVIYANKIENLENLALKLGHKTANSGGFNIKVASIAKYGLADRSKGKIHLTPLALKILMPIGGEKEKYEACREAILTVPLLKRLYERLDGQDVREDDLWGHLYEISGDREASIQQAGAVFGIWRDALTYLRMADKLSPSGQRAVDWRNAEAVPQPGDLVVKDGSMIRLETGDVLLRLPKTAANIDLIISALATMKTSLAASGSERNEGEEK